MKGAVHIGPYRLRRALATSSTSELWAATHGPTQRLVALKVLTPEASRDRREIKAFRSELKNTAVLSNPNIVHCYETGLVDEVAAHASGLALARDTPYLVMELCSGGTLDEIKRPFRWAELKEVLIALLDALAHTHSRGIVHRALRPSSVLLNGADDERSGLKLAGFGLAYHVDGLLLKQQFGPLHDALHYMAPEVAERRTRDITPASDLYSLGLLAWHLSANRRPFRALKGQNLVSAQIDEAVATLDPTGPVPEGFDRWIERLVRKDANKRFQRAADAAWALIRLGDVREDLPVASSDALVVALDKEEPTFVQEKSGRFNVRQMREQLAQQSGLTFSTEPSLTQPELTVFQGTLSPDMPPVPRTWQDKSTYVWKQPLGTGLGLFDHRPIPLVDREEERTALWDHFREVAAKRTARLALVRGTAGIGKSSVARWITQRAHELGAATVLKATHSRTEEPGTSVRRMFSSFLRLAKLSRDDVRERVKNFLFTRGVRQLDEMEALTELVFPSTRVDPSLRRVSGVEERHAVVRRFFRLLTLERPLIVWLEDAHWGNDALALAYSVLENQRYSPMPVFFLLTIREETLAERPVERALIEEIAKLEGSHSLVLEPLRRKDQHTLLQHALGLEESLTTQVVDRTQGNPLLAVEIVGDWVQRGALEPSAAGFILAPGEALVLPDDLHAVWMRRIDRVLEGLDPMAATYLEAAAVLGLEVDEDEWREVTDHPDGFHFPRYLDRGGMAFFPERARIRAKLADRLLDYRLAEETDTGWAFAHGMIRESLLRRAQENGRLDNHHRAAAYMLHRRWGEQARTVAERLGQHLLAGGAAEAALSPLMAGVLERRTTLGVRPALALLATCEETMESLGLPDEDPRWGQAWITRAQLAFMRGEYDVSERWARRAALSASDHPWEIWAHVMHEALFVQAMVALRRSETSQAELLLTQLKSSVSERENPRIHAMAMHGLASVARTRGQTDLAMGHLRESLKSFERADEERGVADCWKEMANIDLRVGQLDDAAERFKRAIEVYERLGDRHKLAVCLNGLAEVARHRGDTGEAEAGYRHALQLFEAVGSAQAAVARLNLALIHLRRGMYGEATTDALAARLLFETEGRLRLLGSAEVVLGAAAAGQRNWDDFDLHIQAASGAMRETAFCEIDAAWCAHKAGDLALQGDQRDRARSAYTFAWYQYRALGDTKGMASLETVIGQPEGT